MQPVMRTVSGLDTDSDYAITQHLRLSENDNRRTAPRPVATVLVVEDEVLVRVAIGAHLRDRGYRVIETGTAEEARAALETGEPIALVFSDINLPGAWQGTDLAAWLRGFAPEVKVILTSSAFHSLAGLKSCDSFLPKPYLAEEVTASVEELLGRERLVR
jgi:CheY-like chemotaxis protein